MSIFFQEIPDDGIYTDLHYSGDREVVDIVRRCRTYEHCADIETCQPLARL
jgi:hypothetical protein